MKMMKIAFFKFIVTENLYEIYFFAGDIRGNSLEIHNSRWSEFRKSVAL